MSLIISSIQWITERSDIKSSFSKWTSSILPISISKRDPKGHILCTWVQCCHLCWRICQDNWVLASFQVSSNSLQQFQRKSWKCQGGQPQSWFSNRPKNTNLVEYVEIFLPVKFRWIMLSSCREEVENFSAKLKARTAILVFSYQQVILVFWSAERKPQKTWYKKLSYCNCSCFLSILSYSIQWFQRRSLKSLQIRGKNGHLCFCW